MHHCHAHQPCGEDEGLVQTVCVLVHSGDKVFLQVKCSQYWPDSCGLVKYANVSVSMLSTEKQADCVIRNFEIVAVSSLTHAIVYH